MPNRPAAVGPSLTCEPLNIPIVTPNQSPEVGQASPLRSLPAPASAAPPSPAGRLLDSHRPPVGEQPTEAGAIGLVAGAQKCFTRLKCINLH
jgi:hypothetical protein